MANQSEKIRVYLIDDHPIVRKGLAQVIDQEEDLKVCGEADGGRQAMEEIFDLNPHIAIVDLALKDMSGLDLIKQIKSRDKGDMKILVLSMHDENLYAERVLRAGAKGYVMKQEATDNLVEAIRKIMSGDLYLSQNMALRMATQMVEGKDNFSSPLERLSDRELEVLRLLGEGKTTREVADQLYLSIKTIETYRANIKEKLHLKNAVELVQYAVKWVERET